MKKLKKGGIDSTNSVYRFYVIVTFTTGGSGKQFTVNKVLTTVSIISIAAVS
jgi:hypothetical protein